MFGYVTADMTALSKQAKSDYKSAYCGVCRALAKRYGARARFILSFDTTFLATVLTALDGGCSCKNARCPYHFGRKRRCMNSDIAAYAADVNVILAYLNLIDDVNDSGSKKAKLACKILKNDYKKASARLPELDKKIKAGLLELSKAEAAGESDPFVTADIFGRLLADVFSYNPKATEFGYHLGRFIYLCDAACDFKGDLKHGRYNPFYTYRASEFEGVLVSIINDTLDSYDKMAVKCYNELIENVLTRGIWLKFNLKYKRKNK